MSLKILIIFLYFFFVVIGFSGSLKLGTVALKYQKTGELAALITGFLCKFTKQIL